MQARSADRAHFALIVLLALAATRGRLVVARGIACADRRRQHRRVDLAAGGIGVVGLLHLARGTALLGRFVLVVAAREGIVRRFELAVVVLVVVLRPARARLAIAIFGIVAAIARLPAIAAAIVAIVLVPVVIRLVLAAIVRPLALGFFLAGLVVGEDAEIMVGELEIVFGLDPVAIVLGGALPRARLSIRLAELAPP